MEKSIEMETLEETRVFFANDRFATQTGAVIEEIGDHYAKCSICLEEKHLNGVVP